MPKLNPITGVGITTKVNMESADLGIMRWDEQRGAIAAVFGDNFPQWRMQGSPWQSPSIVMYDKDLKVLGIPTKEGIEVAPRRQCWDYPHNNPDYSTILPCDVVRVGDWWYMAVMVTAGLGHEKRTVFWRSRDLVDWEKTDPYVRLDHLDTNMRPINHPCDTMLTFDRIGDYMYTFGTGGLARDKPICLWRSPIDEFPYAYFEPWGWDGQRWGWGIANEQTPIIDGRFGELCFRVVQGNCVLSFFDSGAYRQTALTVENPTDDWAQANRVNYAAGQFFPQLYGGYIVPGSKLNERNGMKFLVSQWNTANHDPYHVVEFNDTLTAKGPLKAEEPQPVPPKPVEPLPKPPTMTPQQLYELLMKELSASASEKIVTPEGDSITLRQAIGQIFTKERGLHSLSEGRPRHPAEEDDQLGHVLSTHAVVLQILAAVVAIAEKLDIDIANLFARVQESLK